MLSSPTFRKNHRACNAVLQQAKKSARPTLPRLAFALKTLIWPAFCHLNGVSFGPESVRINIAK